jgi:hypothetical protein
MHVCTMSLELEVFFVTAKFVTYLVSETWNFGKHAFVLCRDTRSLQVIDHGIVVQGGRASELHRHPGSLSI